MPGMMPGSMNGAMMPGSMNGAMMPGSMNGAMMPGSMNQGVGGMNFGRASMVMEEPPNQHQLDQRSLPMVPTPWPGPPAPLMPGQATGVGIDNLHPLMQMGGGAPARLPNAYRMYGYGPREMWWSNPLPVPEQNTGIMINAEFPLKREMEGREFSNYDYAIRNQNWRHQGQWVQPFDPIHDVPDWKHKMFGQYEDARDLKQPMHVKDYMEHYYKRLHEERDAPGLFKIDKEANRRMEMEILDDQELREFWQNPDAVINDRLS